MLKYMSKGVCVLAAAVTFSATTAQADNHVVLIMEGGFFPAVTYVKRGDNVVFTNNSESTIKLVGPEDTWASEDLAIDERYVLNISPDMPLTYVGMVNPGIGEGVTIDGELSFEDAPLSGE